MTKRIAKKIAKAGSAGTNSSRHHSFAWFHARNILDKNSKWEYSDPALNKMILRLEKNYKKKNQKQP